MKHFRTLITSILVAGSLLAAPGYAAEQEKAHAQQQPAAAQVAPASATVNINTADAATLADRLSGIGLKKAQAIVDYRQQNGPFKSVDDLTQVKGIGSATLDKIRSQIAVN